MSNAFLRHVMGFPGSAGTRETASGRSASFVTLQDTIYGVRKLLALWLLSWNEVTLKSTISDITGGPFLNHCTCYNTSILQQLPDNRYSFQNRTFLLNVITMWYLFHKRQETPDKFNSDSVLKTKKKQGLTLCMEYKPGSMCEFSALHVLEYPVRVAASLEIFWKIPSIFFTEHNVLNTPSYHFLSFEMYIPVNESQYPHSGWHFNPVIKVGTVQVCLQMIFGIVLAVRASHQLPLLAWDEKVPWLGEFEAGAIISFWWWWNIPVSATILRGNNTELLNIIPKNIKRMMESVLQ